jgi:hypothetical protein
VADALNARWAGGATRVLYVPEYYDYPGLSRWLERQGIKEVDEVLHDDYAISAQVMLVDPELARMKERIAANKFSINGVPLAPLEKTLAMARRIVEYRADVTVAAIRTALSKAAR